MNEDIKTRLTLIPELPGVYLMFNENSDIIYIGKAVNLRNRIKTYFQSSQRHSPKIKNMVELIHHFEYIITDSEIEALILESSLIKKHKPKYNTLLKDDNGFPYIRITWQDKYPRILFERRRKKDDKSEYFGPYPNSKIVRELLDIIEKIFPLKNCTKPQFKDRPCLYFHIKQCLAPCLNKIDPEEYKKIIHEIRDFLTGKSTNNLINKIKHEMLLSSERLDFERAAILRDVLKSIDIFLSKQKVISLVEIDLDVISLVRDKNILVIQLFQIREGRLINSLLYDYNISELHSDTELLSTFIQDYYEHMADIPKEIIINQIPDDIEILTKWLNKLRQNTVSIHVPKKGYKKQLLDMCTNNANMALERKINEQRFSISIQGLEELKKYLNLTYLPQRIESFDISNIGGEHIVGSMVVFFDGKPLKSDYRKYKIKSIKDEKPNDYKSIYEVVFRRYKRVLSEGANEPDLILIDGGKGQLNAALKACFNLGFKPKFIIGLAKSNEEIFIPDKKEPLILPNNSFALKLIQQIRDEAHRFALKFHSQLRNKNITFSELDQIKGIGEKRKKFLLKTFGSVEKIKEKTIDELILHGKLPRNIAQRLFFKLGK